MSLNLVRGEGGCPRDPTSGQPYREAGLASHRAGTTWQNVPVRRVGGVPAGNDFPPGKSLWADRKTSGVAVSRFACL